MTNFAQELASAVADGAERPAVKLDDLVLNYGLLDAGAQRAAGLLRAHGVEAGDRVGMQLPNVPYFPVVYFGALRLGAVVVPMNPLLKGREVGYHLKDSGAKVLVAWHGFAEPAQAGAEEAGAECILVTPGEFEQALGEAEPVEEIADRADDDPAVIIYTSGTTGTPKGATLTHSNLAAGAETARDLVDAGPDTVDARHAPAVPRVRDELGDERLGAGARAADAAAALRAGQGARDHPARQGHDVRGRADDVHGAAPPPRARATTTPRRSTSACPAARRCRSRCCAGSTRRSAPRCSRATGCRRRPGWARSTSPSQERKPGSIGVPIGGTEFRLVDDDGNDVPAGEPGEIAMRGPFVMRGYWERDDATRETIRDGWFHTGDMATVDDDGYFFIVDRKKELIIRGGYNVYPREIEEVLYEHPAVREAAVVGVPHDALGEEVGAAIALKDGAEASEDEIRAFAKERVAAYKYPRQMWFVEELPKGPTGKVLKREIEAPESS